MIDKFSKSDANFAGSLIQGFGRYGKLSDKQMPWVGTLTQRATAPKVAPVAYVKVDFKPIQDMFDLAAQKLKRIRVKIQDTTGQAVAFRNIEKMEERTKARIRMEWFKSMRMRLAASRRDWRVT